MDRLNKQVVGIISCFVTAAVVGGAFGVVSIYNKPAEAQARPRPVAASSFVLVDPSGSVRASLYFDERDPTLKLMDEAGNDSVIISGTGGMTLMGARNKPAVQVRLRRGEPDITFYDDTGRGRLRARLSNGHAAIGMFNENGELRLLTSADDGEGVVQTWRKDGTERED